MPDIKSRSGLQWHYDVAGTGPNLLFLHGWGVNMMIWRQQYKYFSQQYRTMMIDLPGHGRSEWRWMTLEQITQDLEDVLDQLGMHELTVVGSSFGGLVALKLYDLYPEMITRFSLCGTQAKLSYSTDNPFGLEIERIRKLSSQVDADYPGIINIFFRSLFTKEERATRRFKWLQTFRKTDAMPDKDALANMLEILEKEDLREVMFRIDRPIQFINGTEDNLCPLGNFAHIKEKIPQARFDWFHKCGHFPFVSQPHEYNQILDNFLKSTNGTQTH